MKNTITYKLTTLLLTFALLILHTESSAQTGLYVDLHGGYGLGTSSQNIEAFDFYNYTVHNGSYTLEQVDVSLGQGFFAGLALGFMFNENIGAEIDASYLFGSEFSARDTYSDGFTEYLISANMLRVLPALVISSNMEPINPYAKFGFLLGFGSIDFGITEEFPGDRETYRVKMDDGVARGLHAALGASIQLSNSFSVFGDIQLISMSYAPEYSTVVESTEDGEDQLHDMTVNEKEIDFVDSYSVNTSDPAPSSQPDKQLYYKMPFSSIGLNIGLRWFPGAL